MDEDAYKKNNKTERGGQPGVYGHPLSAEKLYATSFPQADALMRQGWVYESELPKNEQVTETPTVSVNTAGEVADLRARLASAESALEAAKAQAKENQKTENEENTQAAKDTLDREQARKEQDKARNKSEAKVSEANKTLNSNTQKGNR
jgi:hypothetical protein